MPSLSVSRTYETGSALLEADLDAIRLAVPTLVNTTFLDNDNFVANSITASSKLIDNSVTTATIADTTITPEKIATDAVTTVKIADAAVTTAKLPDSSITTVKITDANVTNPKLASSAFSASSYVINSCAASGAIGNNVFTTFLTRTATVTGRPVMLTIDSGGANFSAEALLTLFGSTANNGTSFVASNVVGVNLSFFRDSTELARFTFTAGMSGSLNAETSIPASSFWFLDQPSAGSYTYSVRLAPYQVVATSVDWPSVSAQISGRLVVLEL